MIGLKKLNVITLEDENFSRSIHIKTFKKDPTKCIFYNIEKLNKKEKLFFLYGLILFISDKFEGENDLDIYLEWTLAEDSITKDSQGYWITLGAGNLFVK